MLERDIEAKAVALAKSYGWLAYKFTSPARASVPDRLFLREGVAVFIEFKSEKGRLTVGQEREHARLRAAGFPVFVCRSVQEALDALGLARPV